MKDSKNIEDIFSNAFENFEAPAPDGAWANIQNNIGKSTGAESAASGGTATGGGITLGKIAIIAVTSSILGLGGGYLLSEASETENSKPVVHQEEKAPEIENKAGQEAVTEGETPTKTVTISVPEEDKTNVAPVEEDKTIKEESKERYKITVKEGENSTSNSAVNDWLTTRVDWSENTTQTSENTTSETTTETGKTEEDKTVENTSENTSSETVVNVVTVRKNDAYAEIKTNVTGGYAPLMIDFNPEGEVFQTEWDFGDGSALLEDNKPTYIYTEPGTYTVTLTVTNEDGKKDSDQIVIVVEEGSEFLINTPNIFTPNRDGRNDVFFMSGENINSFNLMIFDRSNRMVYESKDINNCQWNGKLPSGLDAPEGVYLYTYQAIGVDGKKYTDKPQQLTLRR
jgi:gliding motility-associated-like protein